MIPPRNHGGVTFALQFVGVSVRVCVCLCVCVCLSVKKMQLHRFRRGFAKWLHVYVCVCQSVYLS